MKSIKIYSRLIIIIILTIITSMVLVDRLYPVKNSVEAIQNELSKHRDESIKVVKSLDIDDYKITLFLVNDKYIGKGLFKRGINNKYSLESSGFGSNKFYRSSIVKIDSKTDLLSLVVKNYDNRIHTIEAWMCSNENKENNKHVFTVSSKDTYCIFARYIKNNSIDEYLPSKIVFRDKDNNDITHELFELHSMFVK